MSLETGAQRQLRLARHRDLPGLVQDLAQRFADPAL
jgi:hypothetical protein